MLYVYQIDKFDYKYPDPDDLEEILGYPFIVDENYKIQCETLQDFRMFAKLITYQADQLAKSFDKQYAEVFDPLYSKAVFDDIMIANGMYTEEAIQRVKIEKELNAIPLPYSLN